VIVPLVMSVASAYVNDSKDWTPGSTMRRE